MVVVLQSVPVTVVLLLLISFKETVTGQDCQNPLAYTYCDTSELVWPSASYLVLFILSSGYSSCVAKQQPVKCDVNGPY